MLVTAPPYQLAVLAIEQVDLHRGDLIADVAGFVVHRASSIAIPWTPPTATVARGDLLLTVFHDQVGLDLHIASPTGRSRTQAR